MHVLYFTTRTLSEDVEPKYTKCNIWHTLAASLFTELYVHTAKPALNGISQQRFCASLAHSTPRSVVVQFTLGHS